MGFYDDEKTAMKYIRMAEGYDGKELVDKLTGFLPRDAKVLELGMGPGKDLALLAEHYQVTGSDYSLYFVELFRASHPGTDLMVLDAVTMDTERRFDAIYSNKVLHHLSLGALRTSLEQQLKVLNPGGLVCHSFWKGEEAMDMHGLHFEYLNEAGLRAQVEGLYDILLLDTYTEMDRDDSLLLIGRRN